MSVAINRKVYQVHHNFQGKSQSLMNVTMLKASNCTIVKQNKKTQLLALLLHFKINNCNK